VHERELPRNACQREGRHGAFGSADSVKNLKSLNRVCFSHLGENKGELIKKKSERRISNTSETELKLSL